MFYFLYWSSKHVIKHFIAEHNGHNTELDKQVDVDWKLLAHGQSSQKMLEYNLKQVTEHKLGKLFAKDKSDGCLIFFIKEENEFT